MKDKIKEQNNKKLYDGEDCVAHLARPPAQLMVHKPGGRVGATEAQLADCIEAARRHQLEVGKLLAAVADSATAEGD